MIDLNTAWFVLVGLILTAYLILDGYDLGIGIIHLFTRDEKKHSAFINMVGPYWDGNEVWLIVLGGSLFAVFPPVYATLFSGLYLQLFLLLLAIIMRNVGIELRSKASRVTTRRLCDLSFGIGSFLTALLLGVVAGNFIRGMALNEQGILTDSFFGTLSPFAVLFGLTGLSVFVMHGAIYAAMKIEFPMNLELRRVALWSWGIMVVLFVLVESIMAATQGARWAQAHPVLGGLSLLVIVAAIAYIPMALMAKRFVRAFIASSLLWTGLLGLIGLQMFPRLIPSRLNDAYSLTIYNSASSHYAMTVVFVIACMTIPVVIAYSACVYYLLEKKRGTTTQY